MTAEKVLVAMSGGVDSSVAAALLRDAGYDVTGVTMRLWGGPSDQGCCSVSDVDDARRVCQQLDIAHFVFDYAEEFDRHVVGPYVDAHAAGRTPNPCIECNRHMKFDLLLDRAEALGFDRLATGHHVRTTHRGGVCLLRRAADIEKDQSYVLHVVGPRALERCLFPVGGLDKAAVRALAADSGLRTAAKAESQDTCFIRSDVGRETFLGDRIPLRPGTVVELDGREVGSVDAVEMVTVGQRKGLGLSGQGRPRFAVDVDPVARRVTVGDAEDLLTTRIDIDGLVLHVDPPSEVGVQCSAHGRVTMGRVDGDGVVLDTPIRTVAPGQSVVIYDGDVVIGGGLARRSPLPVR